MPESEIRQISSEVWEVLNQARNGKPLAANSGSIETIVVMPFDRWEVYTVLFCMVALVIVFQVIALRSLPSGKLISISPFAR